MYPFSGLTILAKIGQLPDDEGMRDDAFLVDLCGIGTIFSNSAILPCSFPNSSIFFFFFLQTCDFLSSVRAKTILPKVPEDPAPVRAPALLTALIFSPSLSFSLELNSLGLYGGI